MPPLQSPDEDVHFAYVQSLAEGHRLPGSDPAGQYFSADLRTARDDANQLGTIFHQDTAPPAGPAADAFLRPRGLAEDDGTGPNSASTYPPLAYGVMALGYLLPGGDLYDRLYAARVTSALWLLLTTLGAWLLAGELFGRRRLPQLVCAATTGLWPMASFVSGSVNPDGMLIAEWALIAWLGVRAVRRGLDRRTALGLGLVVGLALVTKATSLALAPALAWVGVVAAVRGWRRHGARGLLAPALIAVPVLLVAGAWLLLARHAGRPAYAQTEAASGTFVLREFAVYLWQFYLPPLGFMDDKRAIYPVISELPAYNTWFGMFWGVYGWVTVWFPHWAYRVFLAVSVPVVGGAAVFAARRLRGGRRPARATLAALGVLVLLAAGLVGGVHLTDYNFVVTRDEPFAQGRYLLPLLPLGGLVVAAAVEAVGRRWRPVVAAGWLGGLAAFQVASMALVVSHFYA